MKKRAVYYIGVVLFFLTGYLRAQQKEVLSDSSFNYLTDKYYEFKFKDSIKAEFYSDIYLKKALAEKDTLNIIYGYDFISAVEGNDSIFIDFLDDLIEKTKLHPSKNYPAAAYKEKGRFYYLKNKNENSLVNYLEALRYTNLNTNDSLAIIIKLRISNLKDRDGKHDESLEIVKDIYKKHNEKEFSNIEFTNLLLNLSLSYLINKKIDSAKIFNEKARRYCLKTGDSIMLNYCYFITGRIKFQEKKYDAAVLELKKTLNILNEDEDYLTLLRVNFHIAKCYKKTNNLLKSLKYSFKIDSISEVHNLVHKCQKETYTFLINYYKKNKNLEKQLLYINKLIKVDSILDIREKELAKTFVEVYEIPKLKAEKQEIINQLEKEAKISEKEGLFLFIIALVFILITGYQYNKRTVLQNRFVALQNELISEKKNIDDESVVTKEQLSLPKETVSKILEGLTIFESQKEFTNAKITLNSLAKRLQTNANYLSKTVNHYKDAGFSEYLNTLRINYALNRLQKNSTIRKYTIKAIANEVGFNTSESFAKAFYKKTGLKPSYYIKKLNEKDII